MDIPKRTPLVTDGPEYSRLSESIKKHWYAEGHTDPREDVPDEDLVGFRASEIEAFREQQNKATKDPEERGGKRPSPRGGASAAAAMGGGDNELETNGNEADDEDTTPILGAMGGAHFIPETSLQETGLQAQPGQQSPSAGLSPRDDWSRLTPDNHGRQVARCMICLPLLIVTVTMFCFSLILYMGSAIWLEPGLRRIITQPLILHPSQSFTHPRAYTRMDVYFYNVTPVVDPFTGNTDFRTEEIGPYRYTVNSTKMDVVWNDLNSTVSYRVKQSFHLVQNQSIGDEGDVIHTLNADKIARQLSNLKRLKPSKSSAIQVPGKDFVIPRSVEDILWGEMNSGMQGVDQGILGLLNGINKNGEERNAVSKNETVSPVYNVYTGKKHLYRLNKVYSYNYTRAQNLWSRDEGHHHGAISGTADGDFFCPFANKDDIVMFDSQIKRNVLLKYHKMVTFKGHKCYRYTTPKQDDPSVETSGILANNSKSDNRSVMELDGLNSPNRENVWQAVDDSPYLVSLPPSFTDRNFSTHHYLDVHPVSGITLKKRLCHHVSLPVIYPGLGRQGKDARFMLPIMLVDMLYESEPDNLKPTMYAYSMLEEVWTLEGVAKVLLVFFASVFFVQTCVATLHLCIFRRKRQSNSPVAPGC